MKKTLWIALGTLIVILLGYWLTKEKPIPVYSDTPTEQEQQAIVQEQPAPEAISENDMEAVSPEDAEKDEQ